MIMTIGYMANITNHWFAGWYSGYWSYFVRDSYTRFLLFRIRGIKPKSPEWYLGCLELE